MNLFLDTNVVIDYLAKRESFAEDIYRLIMACSSRDWQLSISALSLQPLAVLAARACKCYIHDNSWVTYGHSC